MRGIIGELDGEDGDVTVMDMEAGLEHLKRGTPRHSNTLLVVAEPYFRSAETAVRTAVLARELGVPRVGVIMNKVRRSRDEQSLRNVFADEDFPVLGVVPFDDAVIEADERPAALIDVDARSAAVSAIEQVADALLQPVAVAGAEDEASGSGGRRPVG